jgi:hypothetical protein
MGHPYQYSNHRTIAKAAWMLRFMALTRLAQALPQWFSPPVYTLVQNSSLAYSDILARALETRERVHTLVKGLAFATLLVTLRLMLG